MKKKLHSLLHCRDRRGLTWEDVNGSKTSSGKVLFVVLSGCETFTFLHKKIEKQPKSSQNIWIRIAKSYSWTANWCWSKYRSNNQIYKEPTFYKNYSFAMPSINIAVWGWFRFHIEKGSSLHQRCLSWANSLNSLCEQPLAPLHPFSSLQSNFIRGEIRLHLTSNDAIWEAEERGFCTTLFYLIVSIWRKEGEQQGERRECEAWQLHIWKQRSVAGSPPPLPPHPLWRRTAVLPSLFPSPSPFSFSLTSRNPFFLL